MKLKVIHVSANIHDEATNVPDGWSYVTAAIHPQSGDFCVLIKKENYGYIE